MPMIGWLLAGLLALLAVLAARAAAFRSRVRGARRLIQPEGGEASPARDFADLPAPARRFLLHSLPPSGPLATAVELDLEQRVKVHKMKHDSPYHVYRMCMVLSAGRGMTATGWLRNGTPRSVLFWYAQGVGEVREALFDLIPVVGRSGVEVSKSLRDRALGDLFLLPSAFLPQNGAQWEAIDDEQAKVTVTLDDKQLPLVLRIDPEGRLREVTVQRWASVGTEDGGFTMIPFGMTVEEERTFDGYTIASYLRGGWWYATDRYVESLQLRIEGARFN